MTGDPMDEDRIGQNVRNPLTDIEDRMDEFEKALAELRQIIADRLMKKPSSSGYMTPSTSLTRPVPPVNGRLY